MFPTRGTKYFRLCFDVLNILTWTALNSSPDANVSSSFDMVDVPDGQTQQGTSILFHSALQFCEAFRLPAELTACHQSIC